MKVEIKEITPAIAREWLATNTNNRSIRKTVVERYRADMVSGKWELNGEAIVMNGGVLLDGQHRLHACIEANMPFQSIVVFDAPTSAMQTIDQGLSRTLGDVLTWKGYTDTNFLASVIRTSWRWDNGLLIASGASPSTAQALDWLKGNERVASVGKLAKRLTGAPLRARGAVVGPVYYKAMLNDENAATEFFDRMVDGEHIAHGNPVYALRRALIQNATRTHGRMPPNPMLAMFIKAWNAWVQAEPMEIASFRRVEKFPVMVGVDGEPISAVQKQR